MSTPVIVQGTPVAAPVQSTTTTTTTTAPMDVTTSAAGTPIQDYSGEGKGEKQETRCRDPFFALLLYGNVGAILAVAIVLGQGAFEGVTQGGDYTGYMWTTLICAAFSFIFSALMLAIMMRFPETMVKTALIFVVVLSGVWTIIAFVQGAWIAGIFGAVFFFIGICYAKAVWHRIPFATCNLVTATTAVKHNCGITIMAYLFALLAFGWSILWAVALFGVWEDTYRCTTNSSGATTCDINYGYLFLLFLSYFFTHQVIQNCVHTSTAGCVGTWWFAPEDSGCCGPAVRDSFCRTVTTSFGSICFGSLLVAIVQALRALANTAQQEGDAGILACIAECILACLQGIIEYFNKWAFVYVGLYGYSYLQAGKNVITLFQNRGWEAIIADDLVGNTLFMLSVIVGGLTGVVGLIIEATSDWFKTADPAGNPRVTAFVLGFIVGLVLCSILMSVIASGVNATIVLFAEAPAEFQQNYPELSQNMRDTWEKAFPGCLR